VSTDAWFHGHLHISEYSRSVYAHAGYSRAHVVGGGVDIRKFSPDPSVTREGGALFVGRLLPHKGIADLIRGLPDGMPLTIVGPAPHLETRERLVALARGKAVTFLHDLDDDSLLREYRRAACIVLPSVYRTDDGQETRVPELLGQTLLEGMACGAPAICTNVASMPEIVEPETTGFVVPPNDPPALGERLAWIRSHPTEASAMGVAARQRVVDMFTWDRVVTRCLDVYAGEVSERTHEPSRLAIERGERG
jgi:glycosyltransferase involved in cell wall biosynthesis